MSQTKFSSVYFKSQFLYSTSEVRNFSNKVGVSVEKLRNLSRQSPDDEIFLREIMAFIEKKRNVLDDNREKKGVVHLNFMISLFIIEKIPFLSAMKDTDTVYLDYGGGNGDIAKVIGRHLGIDDNKRILNVEKSELKFNREVTTLQSIPDVKLGFVTAFHVIHHLGQKTQSILDEIYSKMIPGGYFVVYEHDLPIREKDIILKSLNLIHFMYECVFEGKSYKDFNQDSEETHFYSFEEMKKMIVFTGFTHIIRKELNNRDKSYYSIFRK